MIPSLLIAPHVINILPIILRKEHDFVSEEIICMGLKPFRMGGRSSQFRHIRSLQSCDHENSRVVRSAVWKQADTIQKDRAPFSFSEFSKIYSGDFSNDEQLTAEPEVQFARKLHIPIHAPSIGNDCYFVKEVTRRNGRTQFRLRIASFSRLHQGSDLIFRGKHFDFRDPAPFEKEMLGDEYLNLAKVSILKYERS